MPVDRGALDAQLREIGEGDRWWEQREFRDLPHILHADEQIRAIARGRLIASRLPRLRPGVRWLLVATDARLICLKQDRLARRQVELIPGQIQQARTSRRLRSFQIQLVTALRTYRIRIAKQDAYRFMRGLEPLLPKTTAYWLDANASGSSLPPAVAGLGAIPVVGRVVARLAAPPPPSSMDQARAERLEQAVERLQGDVERLQHQVAFLEDLLRRQAESQVLAARDG